VLYQLKLTKYSAKRTIVHHIYCKFTLVLEKP